MEQQSFPVVPANVRLTVDVVGDFTCPWSFLGTRRVAQALEAVQGLPLPPLWRWHGFRLPRPEADARSAWDAHLAARLPPGVSVAMAEAALTEAGRPLGIDFDFAAIRSVPDTTRAHALAHMAAREALHGEFVDAVFRGYFEHGIDINDAAQLAAIGRSVGLSAAALAEFSASTALDTEVAAEHARLSALGVTNVPNLLLNGAVLVPGSAEVATYVQALDQALFPGAPGTVQDRRLLN